MKNLLKAEEAGMFVLAVYFFSKLSFAWWVFPALLLAPDISMLGYISGPGIGAVLYNLFHHKAIAIGVYLAGMYIHNEAILLAGTILFGHSSMDRVFGYGLKYPDAFRHTSLGMIGKEE